MHLVDTSVWIDFLRGMTNPRVALLEGLLEEGEAYVCEVTFAEICYGARDDRQWQKYRDYFSALPFLSLPPHWYRELAHMGYVLRRKGIRPFTADLLIALTALTHKVPVLTSDPDFQPLCAMFGLKIE